MHIMAIRIIAGACCSLGLVIPQRSFAALRMTKPLPIILSAAKDLSPTSGESPDWVTCRICSTDTITMWTAEGVTIPKGFGLIRQRGFNSTSAIAVRKSSLQWLRWNTRISSRQFRRDIPSHFAPKRRGRACSE